MALRCYHSFELQFGCKRWKYQSQADTLTHPLNRGCTPHYAAAADEFDTNAENGAIESQILAALIADLDFTF